MAFKMIFKNNDNFNFQVNRLLSYGKMACDQDEVIEVCSKITCFQTWYEEWKKVAEVAKAEKRYIHSMYYYRMAEFMLSEDDFNKKVMYEKMQEMFQRAFPSVKKHKVPFENGYLPCIFMKAEGSSKTILLHGGYDSFIEEFYLLCDPFVKTGYNVLLFEGEGQGATLKQGMKFNEKWERSVTVILNYFNLNEVALIGISWGGYFALRAAAYEKRITHVVCFDVCYDGLDVQFHLIKQPLRLMFKVLFYLKLKRIINKLVYRKMRKDPLAQWGISHGMYITATTSPYDFYKAIEKHTLKNILTHINQHVLLLYGEKDHYIPRWHFDHLQDNLPFANVTARLFTVEEGGEQHCRVGNYTLATQYIKNWLRENF